MVGLRGEKAGGGQMVGLRGEKAKRGQRMCLRLRIHPTPLPRNR